MRTTIILLWTFWLSLLLSCNMSILFQSYYTNESSSLGELKSVAADTSNNLYVIGGNGNKIIKITKDGNSEVIYGIYSEESKSDLVDLVLDEKGNVYAIESSGRVIILSAEKEVIADWQVESVVFNSIALNNENNIFVTDALNNRIIMFSSNGDIVKEFMDDQYIQYPQGIYIDDNDNIYFGFMYDMGSLIKINPQGMITPLTYPYIPRVIYVDDERTYLGDQHSIVIYSFDYSERLDYFDGNDMKVFPEASNSDIIDFAVTTDGRIFVIRDNKILVCDKYYEEPNDSWKTFLVIGVAIFFLCIVLYVGVKRKKK